MIASENDSDSQSLVRQGAILETVAFSRGGFAGLWSIIAFIKLVAIYRRWRPILVQQYNAKPMILGTLAARCSLFNKVKIVNTVTGLGHAFVAGGVIGWLAKRGYQISAHLADTTIFQNPDDKETFLNSKWLRDVSTRLIIGSGVDLARFHASERIVNPRDRRTVVMISRLLRQKGIQEFVELARRIKGREPSVRFVLAGEAVGSHPDALDLSWLHSQEVVEYVGKVSDVRSLLSEADVFVFPSYYKEGVPRVILEASAMCVPTIAFDVPGVREAVISEVTGYLIPVHDIDEMERKLWSLLRSPYFRKSFGSAARELMEIKFDLRSIENQYVDLYQHLGLNIR